MEHPYSSSCTSTWTSGLRRIMEDQLKNMVAGFACGPSSVASGPPSDGAFASSIFITSSRSCSNKHFPSMPWGSCLKLDFLNVVKSMKAVYKQ